MHGQTAVVEEVLERNLRLALSSDSQISSPLYIAATEGHVEIARKLLLTAPKMCWWHDEQGMNPIHVAAMNGHVDILEDILEESCLLCVKHAQLRVLKVWWRSWESLCVQRMMMGRHYCIWLLGAINSR